MRRMRGGSRRIYVSEHESGRGRHVLTIGATRDGGLMIVPQNHTKQGWDVYTGSFVTGERRLEGEWPNHVNPRLHYHRSGWTTIRPQNLEPSPPDIGVKLPSMDSVAFKQVFSLTITKLDALPVVRLKDVLRTSDLVNYLHDGMPYSLHITGILVQNRAVPWWATDLRAPDNPFFGLRGEIVETCYSLVGHGLDSFLALRFGQNLDPVDSHHAGHLALSPPTITIVGMCSVLEWPSPYTCATTHGATLNVSMFSRFDLPKFPHDKRSRNPARYETRINRESMRQVSRRGF